MSLNKCQLIGNLGRDPEVRSLENGNTVATLSIATSEKWTDKQSGEKKEKTEWHRVVIWGRTADVAKQYLRKGSKCYVEGKLQTRKWTDTSGVEKYTTEVVLSGVGSKLVMLDRKEGDGGGSYTPNTQASSNQDGNGDYGRSEADELDDDRDEIPF